MKKLVSSTVVLAFFLATTILVTAPAPSQETPPPATGLGAAMSAPHGKPPPDPPDFAFNEQGFVVIDGDVGTSCLDFAQTEEGITRPGDQEQLAQSVVQQCEQAGFLSPNNQYVAYPPAQGQQLPISQAELPSTGGPGLPMPEVPLASGVLLVVLTVLGIVARRRTSS